MQKKKPSGESEPDDKQDTEGGLEISVTANRHLKVGRAYTGYIGPWLWLIILAISVVILVIGICFGLSLIGFSLSMIGACIAWFVWIFGN